MFQTIVPTDCMQMKVVKMNTVVHIKLKQIYIPSFNGIVRLNWIVQHVLIRKNLKDSNNRII